MITPLINNNICPYTELPCKAESCFGCLVAFGGGIISPALNETMRKTNTSVLFAVNKYFNESEDK